MDSRELYERLLEPGQPSEWEGYEVERAFPDRVIDGMALHFRKHLKKIDLLLQIPLEQTLLEPVLSYMRGLQVDANGDIFGIDNRERSIDGLLELLIEIQRLFEQKQAKKIKNSASIYAALSDLTGRIVMHIDSTFPKYTVGYNHSVLEAKQSITAARKKQCYDLLCIACCAGWCPLEYALTLGNCFGTLPCTGSCREFSTSRSWYGLFAPCQSMASYAADFKEQSQLIKRLEPPSQQKMIP